LYVDLFLQMAEPHMRGSVLDAGCGTGRGALALQKLGFDVTLCDLTRNGLTASAEVLPFHETALWANLKRIVGFKEWVYCCDVLEHLPTPFVMLAVSRLLEVCRRGAFFSIGLNQDNFGVWVGKPLHQTVLSFQDWRDALGEVGTLVECRDLHSVGVYLLQPK
jgi:SAM-dependent methyltransferase